MFDAIRTIYNIIKYIKVQQMHGLMVVFNLIPDSLSFFSVEHSYNNYNNNNNNIMALCSFKFDNSFINLVQ